MPAERRAGVDTRPTWPSREIERKIDAPTGADGTGRWMARWASAACKERGHHDPADVAYPTDSDSF